MFNYPYYPILYYRSTCYYPNNYLQPVHYCNCYNATTQPVPIYPHFHLVAQFLPSQQGPLQEFAAPREFGNIGDKIKKQVEKTIEEAKRRVPVSRRNLEQRISTTCAQWEKTMDCDSPTMPDISKGPFSGLGEVLSGKNKECVEGVPKRRNVNCTIRRTVTQQLSVVIEKPDPKDVTEKMRVCLHDPTILENMRREFEQAIPTFNDAYVNGVETPLLKNTLNRLQQSYIEHLQKCLPGVSITLHMNVNQTYGDWTVVRDGPLPEDVINIDLPTWAFNENKNN